MSRIICVSNRIALPDPETGEIKAGGLAVGVQAALEGYHQEGRQGGIWFGWDGAIIKENGGPRQVSEQTHGNITFLTIPLTEKEYEGYYKEMANENLWPLMHGLSAHIDGRRESYEVYREVNRLFAKSLRPFLRPDDIIWVHDYHLIPLGFELRMLGTANPIGFFNHIPIPSRRFLENDDVPFFLKKQFRELAEDLFYYDLVGFQSFRDYKNFCTLFPCDQAMPARFRAVTLELEGDKARFGVFPISIETGKLINLSQKLSYIHDEPGDEEDCEILIGAERLDYTKGIIQRMRGYALFLERHPEFHDVIQYHQITPLSRSDIQQYKRTIIRTREAADEIEKQFGHEGWMPLDYSEEGIPRQDLIHAFRHSRIGLVTPLIDGQNLVAKEYIAAQNPHDPGVLVLSANAGAAEELAALGVLCVDPYDPSDIADKIEQAFKMTRAERISIYRKAIGYLFHHDINHWVNSFIDQLLEARIEGQIKTGTYTHIKTHVRSS